MSREPAEDGFSSTVAGFVLAPATCSRPLQAEASNDKGYGFITQDDGGNAKERVVSRLESDGKLYVAANHWPRRWYNEVLAHPQVQVTWDGTTQAYVAVPVTGEEFDRVNAAHALPTMVRVLTGFPPRRLVRLDPA